MSDTTGDQAVASCVGPGVWATAIPFPSVLGYSYSYSVRVSGGVIIVDSGWDSDSAWQVFADGLAQAGVGLDEIIGVVATHAHPDHYGLAGRIRAESNAWIAIHEAEMALVLTGDDHADRVADMARWLRRCGVPDDEDGVQSEMRRLAGTISSVQPDFLLADEKPVPGTDGELIAIHTPGHTAGHLCFHDVGRRLFYSGDHLLPKTRTHVAKRPGNSPDPLGDFLGSLERVAAVAAGTVVLPGHEWSFDTARERIQALASGHARRLDEVEAVVVSGADTVWRVAQRLRWSRSFDEFSNRAKRQVIGETHAHLFRLARSGRLAMRNSDLDRDATVVWEPLRR